MQKDEIKEIHNKLEKENKAPTMNNIREKLGLERIENNNKDEAKEELDDLLSRNQNKLLLDCIINLQKDNKKLKHSLWEEQELNEYLRDKLVIQTNLQEEKERYKNIIDELEEELERETNIKEEDTSLEHNTYLDINQTLKKVLNRLKELKGSDK